MFVYRGKPSQSSAETSDEIVVIFPDGIEPDRPALAVWQQAPDGGSAPSRRALGTIDQVVASDSRKVVRFSGGPDYRFEGTVSADGTEIVLDITTGHDDARQQSVLRLSSDIAHGVAAIKNKNSVIFNDTSDIYYCSLEESSSHANIKSIILGSVGALYGFIGLLTLAPGTPFIIGAGIAAQGAILAGGSLLDTLIPSSTDGPVETLLLPQRRISRYSESGVFVAPDNAITLTRVTIRNGHILSVQMASYDGLGDGETDLSIIIDEIGDNWKTLLELDLGSDQNKTIEARAVATIAGLDVQNKLLGQAFDYTGNLVGCDGGAIINYQTQGLADSYKFPPSSGQNPTFAIRANSVVAFIESPDAPLTSNTSVFALDSTPLALVWRLPQYAVDDPSNGGTSLGQAQSEDDVKDIVAKYKGTYLAYSWSGAGGLVLGYSVANNPGVQIVPTSVSSDIVYISVSQEQPYLKTV